MHDGRRAAVLILFARWMGVRVDNWKAWKHFGWMQLRRGMFARHGLFLLDLLSSAGSLLNHKETIPLLTFYVDGT
jgi:hypothetical protein